MTREYKQGVVTLAFPGGPGVTLRLNPVDVRWGFKVNTSVTETVGGRVVQVLGATLSDMTVYGSFGERRGGTHVEGRAYAETFLASMKAMAEYQALQSTQHRKMHEPAIFSFPPKGWRFAVYIKDLSDPDGGGGITHRAGKFAYDYVLTLMIHEDLSDTNKILGAANGDITQAKDKAIASYIARIANGIGWHASEYNGRLAAEATQTGATASGRSTATTKPVTNAQTGQRRIGGPLL